jgi:hypothetical protein
MRSIGVGKNASSLGAGLATVTLPGLPADSFSSLLGTATRSTSSGQCKSEVSSVVRVK